MFGIIPQTSIRTRFNICLNIRTISRYINLSPCVVSSKLDVDKTEENDRDSHSTYCCYDFDLEMDQVSFST